MTRKIIAVVLVLVIALVIGIQFFLAYGLTDSLRKWVLPVIKERYHADVSVNNVSVNLLGGALNVHGIKVANPPGFDEPVMILIERCGLKVGLPALFKAGGGADIQKAIIKEVKLSIVRNKDGALNLDPILSAMREAQKGQAPANAAAQAATEQKPGDAKQAPLANVVIKKMEMITKLNYLDWQIGQPFKLGLEMNLLLSNISNYGPDDSLSGAVNLHGNILEADKKCAFDLNGRISPVVDPLLVSFDLTGSIQTIDLKTFKGLIENIGLQGGNVSGTMTLICRKGQFDPEKSVIRLKFSDVVLTQEKADKMRGIPLPSSFNVLVPVTGPLAQPQINIAAAFLKTITSEDMVNSIIKGIVSAQGAKTGDTADGAKNVKSEVKDQADKISDVKGLFGDILGGKDKK